MSEVTTGEWLKANKANYKSWEDWINGCVEELGVSRGQVLKKSHQICLKRDFSIVQASAEMVKARPMNRAQFLSKYDINTKTREAIRRGINTLTEQEIPEQDEILEDSDFRLERCGDASLAVYRKIANEQEFKELQFGIGDKIFWATKRQRNWAIENVPRAKEI